jgi:hypothetical protein
MVKYVTQQCLKAFKVTDIFHAMLASLSTIIVYILFDIGAGVAQSVQCLAMDWTIQVRSSAEAKDFSSNLCVQTNSQAHPVSCPMGTRGPFLGGKVQPGRDADYSPPSSAEVVNV